VTVSPYTNGFFMSYNPLAGMPNQLLKRIMPPIAPQALRQWRNLTS
jgi:hypothetical protein